MLASLGVATCLVDATEPGLPLAYVNPAFEELTGYPAAEALGRNCRFLQGEHTDPRAVAEIRGALERGEGCRVTLLNHRRDGSPFWNELTITPVPGPGDEPVAFIGALVDVTGRGRGAPARLPRFADGPAQPLAARRAAARRGRPRPPARPRVGAAVHRPRQLQARQRLARPLGRRPSCCRRSPRGDPGPAARARDMRRPATAATSSCVMLPDARPGDRAMPTSRR